MYFLQKDCKCNFLHFQLCSLAKPRVSTIINNWKYGKCSISENFTNRNTTYKHFTILISNFSYLFMQFCHDRNIQFVFIQTHLLLNQTSHLWIMILSQNCDAAENKGNYESSKQNCSWMLRGRLNIWNT